MPLKNIIGISRLVLVTCATSMVTVPIHGTIDRNAKYSIRWQDKNMNGLCDGYEIIGKGMMPGIIYLDKDEEMTATNLVNLLRKQGLKISNTTKFY